MRAFLVAGVVLFTATSIASLAAQSAQTGEEKVYRPGQGVTDPAIVRPEAPKYTRGAMTAGIQGVVELEAVVLPNGTVGDVRVTKSLDTEYGLDAEAVRAARQWRFKPGELEGKPVPVLITLVLEFRLHPGGQQAPAQKDDDFARGAYLEKAPGVVPPKIVKQVAPKYTAEAMRNKIQGVVVIEAVVGEDGKVARARVTESLDTQYGLDQAGLDAAGQWEFTAGTFEGRPVPVLVTLKLEFRLHQP